LNTNILIISISIFVFFIISNDNIYAQKQTIDEFLDWPSETNYHFVFVVIVILIGLTILANYLWSKRKGRRYSEE